MDLSGTILIAVVLSGILLAPYWIITRRRKTLPASPSSTGGSPTLSDELHQILNSKPPRVQDLHRDLQRAKVVAGSFLIVGIAFFLAGGVAYDRSLSSERTSTSSHYVPVALFGWSLFVLSAAAVNVAEGIDAIAVKASITRPIPLFTKRRLLLAHEATRFGLFKVLVGFAFLALILASLLMVLGVEQLLAQP